MKDIFYGCYTIGIIGMAINVLFLCTGLRK